MMFNKRRSRDADPSSDVPATRAPMATGIGAMIAAIKTLGYTAVIAS